MTPTTECLFCKEEFQPRPQTKNPQACVKKCCQYARQRANEKDWRLRNGAQYGAEYYRAQRKSRNRFLSQFVSTLAALVLIGAQFKNQPIEMDSIKDFFQSAAARVGIRAVKKLWGPSERVRFFEKNHQNETS